MVLSKLKANNLLNLSAREHQVLNLICQGNTFKDIASLLFISPYTVISHKKNLISKFKAKNLVHLGVLAERNGYLEGREDSD